MRCKASSISLRKRDDLTTGQVPEAVQSPDTSPPPPNMTALLAWFGAHIQTRHLLLRISSNEAKGEAWCDVIHQQK